MSDERPFAEQVVRTGDPGAAGRLHAAIDAALGWMADPATARPRSDLSPAEVAALVASVDICPEAGAPLDDVLERMGRLVWRHGVSTSAADTAAHLHVPTLVASAATEAVIGATNQSMDSWDQSPAGTDLELRLLAWLGGQLGLGPTATGVMTPGGTASNLLGLTLARAAAGRRIGIDVAAEGLPEAARSWRIVCSRAAHFSVERAAAQLGLGRERVVAIPTDERDRLDLAALDAALGVLRRTHLQPIVIVATAGTTDAGAVDPIVAMASRAHDVGCWFHVDAAVGGGFVLSDRMQPLLAGTGQADSVTVDFHKLWFQPISASALLVPDASAFDALRVPSDYLDRGDEPDGVVNLVGRSLDTTRRFDAAKVVAGLAAVGRRTMGAMVDHLVDLAAAAADEVDRTDGLELARRPESVMCLFRTSADDELARAVQQDLLVRGEAIIGRTVLDDRQTLKLTFVNPLATEAEVRALVRRIADLAH